jgi:primosomal protein N' (replication factor Y)
VFDDAHLALVRWAAGHYVAPLATVLKRTVPPNVPRTKRPVLGRTPPGRRTSLLHRVASAPHGHGIAEGIADSPPDATIVVVAPSVVEVDEIAAAIERRTGRAVVTAHSSMAAKEVTGAWQAAMTRPGTIIVGTREIALWWIPSASEWIIVEDARRVMRSPATPTLSVRSIALERHRAFGTPTSFVGPLPSLEVIHARATIADGPGRQWPLVEVLDRNEEPPGSSVLLEATRSAVAGAVRQGGSVFVLVPRRAHASAERCVACQELRRCASCGSAAFTDGACARCSEPMAACPSCGGRLWRPLGAGIGVVVDDLRRLLGRGVGRAGEGRTVTVGTERDLLGVSGCRLAVSVDVDGMTLAPHYRAAEDALRTLVRLAQTVERGRGHRCVVQTSDPRQPAIVALRSGRSDDFLRDELQRRRRAGFPPFGELIALEVADIDGADDVVRSSLEGLATVHGPARVGERDRWLITGPDLTRARLALRRGVGTMRDRGARVRIDVDPIDL